MDIVDKMIKKYFVETSTNACQFNFFIILLTLPHQNTCLLDEIYLFLLYAFGLVYLDIFLFYLYIYPPDLQESNRGTNT